jgi:hypothetical protein
MHSLFPPLIVGDMKTRDGVKQIAIEAGVSDNIYAVDVDSGQVIWKKHFEYPPITEGRGFDPDDPLCPGGQTATPVIGPRNEAGERTVYALAGDGKLTIYRPMFEATSLPIQRETQFSFSFESAVRPGLTTI